MADAQNPLSVEFFRNLVQKETLSLTAHCVLWRETCKSQDIPENVEGDILVAIGQTELLMRKRFVQFSSLIDDCEFKRGEKETTPQDLQGFWDIVYFQVEDINKKFKQLTVLQNNNWIEPKPEVRAVIKKKVVAKPLTLKTGPLKSKIAGNSNSSAMRAHILAARQRLQDASDPKQNRVPCQQIVMPTVPRKRAIDEDKENMTVGTPEGIKSPEKAVFDAGFFKVITPVKKLVIAASRDRHGSSGHLGKVLSSAVLRERIRASPFVHKDYSPCMRITRSMKSKGTGTRLMFDK